MKLFRKDPQFYKNVFTLALPIAAQSLITIGVNMLDIKMVGKLGDGALVATSQANSFINVYHILCMGLGMGASVLVSRYWGMKKNNPDDEKAAMCLNQCKIRLDWIFQHIVLAFIIQGRFTFCQQGSKTGRRVDWP